MPEIGAESIAKHGILTIFKMMQSGKADVAVIIINYDTAELALNAVESVLAFSHGGHHSEIHLLDNASPQGDGDVLQAEIVARGWQDDVVLYKEAINHGFGRGNNRVLNALASRPTPPRYVFLLNPDAKLENDAIAILADFLDARPEAAVAGAGIAKPGGIRVTSAFRFPSIVSTFSSALSFGPVSRLLSHWQVPLSPSLPTSQVDWVAGAAAMIRFDAARQAGFFDPAYFLYYEEVDLMRQIKRLNRQIWFVAEAQVIHVEGAATNVKSGQPERRRRPAYWYESWRHYFRKNHGRAFALTAATAWLAGAAANEIISRVKRGQPSTPLLFFQDIWAIVVRPLLGLKALPHE